MHPELYFLDWFESIKRYGSKPGLHPVKKLLDLLDSPQQSFDSIHVTGTNGKGSTTVMTASILQKAGYKVGVFTSPHLSKINESIKVDGIEINETEMNEFLGQIKDQIDVLLKQGVRHPTHFEVLVALAYSYFRSSGIEIAVVEVGMGGRDDATNVLDSMASIVTNIGLEHTDWLGENLEQIAENKAGILNNDTVLITAATQPEVIQVLENTAKNKGSRLIQIAENYQITPIERDLTNQTFTLKTPERTYTNLRSPLLGAHQLRNAACALAAIEIARKKGYIISEKAIRDGLLDVEWPGRFEIVENEPLVVLDGAKDVEAIIALVETVKTYFSDRKIITVLGVSNDKAHIDMIKNLAEITTRFIVTEHRVKNRTTKASELKKLVEITGKPVDAIVPIDLAINHAKEFAKPSDVILVTGSVFLIGEARANWS